MALSQTSTAAADPKKAMVTDQTYPSNLMITAEVQVNSWNAGDMARAGVGLYTNPSNGFGYNLVFHGTNQVQFLDDYVTWGNAYTFNWQVGTWYWFQLAEINGTLEGKVWAAGTAEPQNWMFQQTGWTDLTGGAPALDGGSASASAGSSTVSFASVSVTTTSVQPDTASFDPTAPNPTTPPLPSPIAGTNYQLVWSDEFNGTSIDASKWNQVGPWGHPVASIGRPISAIHPCLGTCRMFRRPTAWPRSRSIIQGAVPVGLGREESLAQIRPRCLHMDTSKHVSSFHQAAMVSGQLSG